jgi:cytoskeleton protein RodZ
MTESAAPVETPLALGDRLRSGRRARALSLEQAARALHLEESLLAALEDERFAEVGAPVFVRGHLRNYARLLGLDEEAIIAAYRSADPSSEQAPRIARDRERPLESRPGPMALAAAAAVVVLAVVAWLVSGEEPTPAPPVAVPTPGAPVAAGVPSTSTPLPVPPPEPVAGGAVVEPEPAIASAPAIAGGVRVEFAFAEDSWIRVGADGRWLADGIEKAGTTRVIDAVPPVEVTLGNAAGVRLRVNGADYALPAGASSPGSNVARFRIEGPSPAATSAPDPTTAPVSQPADGATE